MILLFKQSLVLSSLCVEKTITPFAHKEFKNALRDSYNN